MTRQNSLYSRDADIRRRTPRASSPELPSRSSLPAAPTCSAPSRASPTLYGMTMPRDPQAALEAYDEAMGALGDAAARASVCRNAHPDAKMRDAADHCEQEVDALATELSLDRGVYDTLAAIDLDGADARHASYYVQKTLRDLRRAGVDKDDATRARVTQAARGAAQDRPGVRQEHQGRRAHAVDRSRRARRPARRLQAAAQARRRRQGHHLDRQHRLHPVRHLRQERQGARGAVAPLSAARPSQEPRGARRACSRSATSWRRCSATRAGPPTRPKTR